MASKEYLGCSSTNIGANSWFDLSKSDYAKVIFCDLYHKPGSSVGCRFQITDHVHEDPSDYVGLFKVGYENLSQCLVMKMLSETECEEDGKMLRCTFKSHELPKLECGFYQFLYVTRDKEVCGASLPFEIKHSSRKEASSSDSSDEDIVADKTEDDFLVVRSTIAEQNRNLQLLMQKMNQKSMEQERFYSGCVNKLSKEKSQLERELKRVREERDLLSEECKKIMEEKDIICKENEATIQNLEQQIIGLASKIEVAYDKFRGLEKVKEALEKEKNEAIEGKVKIEESCDRIMKELDTQLVAVHKLQQELKLKNEQNLKNAADIENISVLASQLEDTKLMISALEESKQLVMNEVTQLTESNKELKENLKELRCENLALKLKLKDAETLNDKIKRRNQNLKTEVAAFKLHFIEGNLPSTSSKVQNTTVEPVKFPDKSFDLKLGTGEEKVLNMENNVVEEGSLKVQLDKLQAELLEKEAVISKLKEDCLKKDAVVEYLSKEKDNIHKTSTIMEDALNDSVLRLKDAAEIYKKQYLEIEKLKKKLEKVRSKCKQRHSSGSSSIRDELSSSVEVKDEIMVDGAKPLQSRSSDSDTGEHVLGNPSEAKKHVVNAVPIEHEKGLQSGTSSDEVIGHKKLSDDRKFKDVFGQSLDISYLAVAGSSNQTPSKSRQSPELQSMIDQNLAKLSLTKSKEEEEVMYSIPCPICDADIGIYSQSSEEMIKHLEIQHKQQICPVCDKLFDMTLPQKYFQFHVEDHFRKGNCK